MFWCLVHMRCTRWAGGVHVDGSIQVHRTAHRSHAWSDRKVEGLLEWNRVFFPDLQSLRLGEEFPESQRQAAQPLTTKE